MKTQTKTLDFKYRVYAFFSSEVLSTEPRPIWLRANPSDTMGIFDLTTAKCIFTAASLDELKLKALVAGISDEDVDPIVFEYDSSGIGWCPSAVHYR